MVANEQQVLYFDDVKEGDQAPVKKHRITRTDMVRYAGASGDYMPMHHDEVFAKSIGQPSVFGHGMYSMGLLGAAITDWVGKTALTKYKVRFSSQTWPDEELRTEVTVKGKIVEGERHLVDLDCKLLNADGDVKVVGEAQAELPVRG
ncbi:MAG: dehydratase [Actinobacteria bacterium]|jgi:acyl dehydratase|nr:dehydratase [Actinomycetota bacterium]MCL5885447.1 dehydratase [Actinomycetota bacterium]